MQQFAIIIFTLLPFAVTLEMD